jgi:hypothetical protein
MARGAMRDKKKRLCTEELVIDEGTGSGERHTSYTTGAFRWAVWIASCLQRVGTF